MQYAQSIKVMNEAFAGPAAESNQEAPVNFPTEITITMSLACNYRCSMCYQQDFSQTLQWEAVERVIPVLPFASTLQLFGGEPLLYKHIHKLYRLAHENLCQISMISNGSLLTEEMVDSIVENQVHCIKFSLDACSPDTYRKIRGGDFFNVLKGIARLAKRKVELGSHFPVFDFNFLAMRSNVKELSRLVATASELGARMVNVFYPSMHKEELVDDCVYFHQEYSDDMLAMAREIGRKLGVPLSLPPLFRESGDLEDSTSTEMCREPWTKALVGADGDVSVCCAGATSIGSLYEHAFDELWNSERARRLRRVVNTPREPAFCKHCRIRKINPHNPELHMPLALLQSRLERAAADKERVTA